MSLRIVFALAVIGGVTGDSNVTTTPGTDGLARPDDHPVGRAEKTQLSGEVRTCLGGCYFTGWWRGGHKNRRTELEKNKSVSEIWTYVFVVIVIPDLYTVQKLQLKEIRAFSSPLCPIEIK